MITEAKKETQKQVSEKAMVDSLSLSDFQRATEQATNSHTRIRRVREPRIRPHISKGHEYYYFIEGDREIYLGDARTILSWKPKIGGKPGAGAG